MKSVSQYINGQRARKAAKIRYRQKERRFQHYIGDQEKRATDRRIVQEFDRDGREWRFHATKGWRFRRSSLGAAA